MKAEKAKPAGVPVTVSQLQICKNLQSPERKASCHLIGQESGAAAGNKEHNNGRMLMPFIDRGLRNEDEIDPNII